ncbi:hypothetical protein SEVIR_4G114732v4 [Setaria viridis]
MRPLLIPRTAREQSVPPCTVGSHPHDQIRRYKHKHDALALRLVQRSRSERHRARWHPTIRKISAPCARHTARVNPPRRDVRRGAERALPAAWPDTYVPRTRSGQLAPTNAGRDLPRSGPDYPRHTKKQRPRAASGRAVGALPPPCEADPLRCRRRLVAVRATRRPRCARTTRWGQFLLDVSAPRRARPRLARRATARTTHSIAGESRCVPAASAASPCGWVGEGWSGS